MVTPPAQLGGLGGAHSSLISRSLGTRLTVYDQILMFYCPRPLNFRWSFYLCGWIRPVLSGHGQRVLNFQLEKIWRCITTHNDVLISFTLVMCAIACPNKAIYTGECPTVFSIKRSIEISIREIIEGRGTSIRQLNSIKSVIVSQIQHISS